MYVKIFPVNTSAVLCEGAVWSSVNTTGGHLSHCTFWCALCKQYNKSVNFFSSWPHYECFISMWNWQRDLHVSPLRALSLKSSMK